MSEQWFRDYVQLQFRMDKAICKFTESRFVDYYMGRRVLSFIDLPQGEEVELDVVSNKVFGGENWYLGNYRSRIELNTDLPTNMRWLMDLVCHEGYPGHHTEFVMEEQHLYRERGYIDQAISPNPIQ